MNSSPSSSVGIATSVERFLCYCRVGRALSPHTLRAYRSDFADFTVFVGPQTHVRDIGREVVRTYATNLVDGGRLKETSVRRRLAALKVLFRWFETEELVSISPFYRLNLSMRLPRRLPRALHSDEMRRLLRRAGTSITEASATYDDLLMYFIVVGLFTTGVRIGEFVGVRIRDVHKRSGALQVRGKGNRERRVFMPGKQATDLLARFLSLRATVATENEILLVRANGAPVTEQYARRRIARLGEMAGIVRRVTPHMLRHTAATQLLAGC